MATPNYGYEKRQKELAKKRKKDEKLKQKAERAVNEAAPDDTLDGESASIPGEPDTSSEL